MSKEWKSSELKLLDSLAVAYRGKNWKTVAKEMAKEGFLRTQVQCRYKWVNYIAPGINHNPWSQEELVQLFKGYEQHKSQWALIQRTLPGRTQIKIRNQFYGTLRNLLRFAIKYFKTGNGYWSLISNQVKPQTLQNLFDGVGEFEFVGDTIREAIREMDFKFKKEKFDLIISQNEEIFKKIVHIINNSDCLIKRRPKKQEEGSAKIELIESENEEQENREENIASGNLPNQHTPNSMLQVEPPVNFTINNSDIGQAPIRPTASGMDIERSRYPVPFNYFPTVDAVPFGNVDYNGFMGYPQMQYYNYSTLMGGRPGFYYPF